MKRWIIGLCGYRLSGKDTAAKLLMRLFRERHDDGALVASNLHTGMGWSPVGARARMLAWADHVRRVAALAYNVPEEIMFNDALKDTIDPRWGITYRQMQVAVGEAGRAAHRDTWTRPVTDEIDKPPRFDPIQLSALFVVSGTRFAREADVLRERGGQLWMIDRGLQSDGTATERDPWLLKPEVYIPNHGTIEDLEALLRRALPDDVFPDPTVGPLDP